MVPKSSVLAVLALLHSVEGSDYGESVLILVPIGSTNPRRQRRLCSLILKIEWHRKLMHVGFLTSIDSSRLVRENSHSLRDADPPLGSVRVYPEPPGLSRPVEGDRHALGAQKQRRANIARARNYLFSVARPHVDWVLWLDCDLLKIPSNLLMELRKSNVDLVVPACYCSGHDFCGSGIYDRNSWQHTRASKDEVARINDTGVVVVRGYEGPTRDGEIFAPKFAPLYFDDLAKSEGNLVPLDGIGATCILIRADLHRQGVIFPAFPVNHAIESEGLAQIALLMGIQPYGRTDIAIKHA